MLDRPAAEVAGAVAGFGAAAGAGAGFRFMPNASPTAASIWAGSKIRRSLLPPDKLLHFADVVHQAFVTR
jgi:hypothetical protein